MWAVTASYIYSSTKWGWGSTYVGRGPIGLSRGVVDMCLADKIALVMRRGETVMVTDEGELATGTATTSLSFLQSTSYAHGEDVCHHLVCHSPTHM